MIAMQIETVVVGVAVGTNCQQIKAPTSAVILRPHPKLAPEYVGTTLPIQVGPIEASCIAAALDEVRKGIKPTRPLTHQTFANAIEALDAKVSRVVIDKVEGNTFCSAVYLHRNDHMFVRLDARPSDALALAIRSNAILYVEEEVLQAAGCPSAFTPGASTRIEMEEFHKFVENINPEDFAAHQGNN